MSVTTARREGARCSGRLAPGTAGPTARQGAAARPPPDAPGGFPRSAPRSPADRSGRFQPQPAPRLTARALGETDRGRAHLVGGRRERRGCGEDCETETTAWEATLRKRLRGIRGGVTYWGVPEKIRVFRTLKEIGGARGEWFPRPSSGNSPLHSG